MYHPGAPISWDPATVLQMVNPACGKRACPALTQQKHRCTIPRDPASLLQAEILLNKMSLRDPSDLLRDDELLQRLADQVLCKRFHLKAADNREYAVCNWKKLIQDWVRAQDQATSRSAFAGTRGAGRDDERDDGGDRTGGAHAQRVSRSAVLKSEPAGSPAVKNEDASFPAIKEEPRDFSHDVFGDVTATPPRGREQQEQTPTMRELLRQLRELTIRVDTLEEENARLVRRQEELEDRIEEQSEEIKWLMGGQSDCED